MSTCAKPSSSIRCVGGAQARPVGAYSRSAAVNSSCMSTPPSSRPVSSSARSSSVRAGHVAERVAQLVDQRDVLDRRGRRRAPRLREQPLLLRADHAVADPGQELRLAQPAEHLDGVERRPPGGGEVEEVLVREHLVVERLAAAVAAALAADLAPHRVEQRVGHPRQLPVAPTLRHQLAADRAELPAVEEDHVVAPEDPELARAAGRLLARGAPHQLGHPGRALDVGDGRLVVPGRPHPVDDLAERAQRDRGLAEAGQHPLDVAHEDAARADDQHAAALVAAAVGVEQVRRAVQRDDGLAGAGAAGDRRRRPCRARGSPCPARPGWSRRSSASSGRGRGRAAPSARPRRRSAGSPRSSRAPRRRAARPRRRRRSRRRSAAPGGVRRRAARPRSPGRTRRRPARASRSAASRGRRRAARSGRRSAARGRRLASMSRRPKTSPSCAASSWAIRRAAWNTIASRSTRPPSWPRWARLWPSLASACACCADAASWT